MEVVDVLGLDVVCGDIEPVLGEEHGHAGAHGSCADDADLRRRLARGLGRRVSDSPL